MGGRIRAPYEKNFITITTYGIIVTRKTSPTISYVANIFINLWLKNVNLKSFSVSNLN